LVYRYCEPAGRREGRTSASLPLLAGSQHLGLARLAHTESSEPPRDRSFVPQGAVWVKIIFGTTGFSNGLGGSTAWMWGCEVESWQCGCLSPFGRLRIATRRKPVGKGCLHRRAPAGRLKVSVAPLGLRINVCGVHGLAPVAIRSRPTGLRNRVPENSTEPTYAEAWNIEH